MPHSSYHYSIVTAERALNATTEEYEALNAALEDAEEQEDGECRSWFETECYDGKVYVFAEDGNYRYLPQTFRTLLGALIAKNGLKSLKFDVAFLFANGHDDPEIEGTYYFRIRRNGSLYEPSLYYGAKGRLERTLQTLRTLQTFRRTPNDAQQPTALSETETSKQGSREA